MRNSGQAHDGTFLVLSLSQSLGDLDGNDLEEATRQDTGVQEFDEEGAEMPIELQSRGLA